MPDPEELTVDELARRVGMTVRNVRAHQSRGLLPPPEIRGRTGYYGPEHIERLELVKELQAEGFTLESIKRVLDRAPGGSVGKALDFTRALTAPFIEEEPEVVEGRELAGRFGDALTPEVVRKVAKLGFVRPLGEERYEVVSPSLLDAAEEIVRTGVPLVTALELIESVRRHADSIARGYVRLFLEHVWRPFEEEGEPDERWPEVRGALDRLRPLATQSVVAVFQLVMGGRVERALERELERRVKGRR